MVMSRRHERRIRLLIHHADLHVLVLSITDVILVVAVMSGVAGVMRTDAGVVVPGAAPWGESPGRRRRVAPCAARGWRRGVVGTWRPSWQYSSKTNKV